MARLGVRSRAAPRSPSHSASGTDVLAGMITGGLTGWLVPSLFHYGVDGKGKKKLGSLPMPYANNHTLGVQWIGIL